MWVPLIENNEHLSIGADYFIRKNVKNLIDADPLIDTVMLGCTHFPLIEDKIKSFRPEGIAVVSQGEIVARSLADYLTRHPEMEVMCTKNSTCQYFSTESIEKFTSSASIFLNEDIHAEHINLG